MNAVEILEKVRASGVIDNDLALAMRRCVYADGVISRAEAGALFDIERVRGAHNAVWSTLFRESLVDLALNQTAPHGYLTESDADWIIAQIGEKQDARSDTQLEALVAIVEQARDAPLRFSAYVLRQIKNAVLYGDGVDAAGRKLTPGVIGPVELQLMRRTVWGAGSGGLLAISKEEAEALFEIADATTGADNSPEWDDFFARAVGNYLIGATSRPVVTREEALQAWHTDYHADMLRFLSAMLTGISNFDLAALKEGTLQARVDQSIAHDEMARAQMREAAERLVGDKAGWLVDRLNRNDRTNGPERQLMRFIAEEARALSPELQAMIERLLPEAAPAA